MEKIGLPNIIFYHPSILKVMWYSTDNSQCLFYPGNRDSIYHFNDKMSFVCAYTFLQSTIQVIMYRFIVTHIDFSIEIVRYWMADSYILIGNLLPNPSCAAVLKYNSTSISLHVNASVQQHISTSSIFCYYYPVNYSFTIFINSSYSISILITSNFWLCRQTGKLVCNPLH